MPFVFRTKHFPPKPYFGISTCGLIFFRKDANVDDSDIQHEVIHFHQQREWLFIGFFIIYLFEFLWRLIRYRSWDKAYRTISFEQEAYAHERDKDYLKNRRWWANYRKEKKAQ